MGLFGFGSEKSVEECCQILKDKYTPKEVCMPERIAEIREENLAKIKEYIEELWEKRKMTYGFTVEISKLLRIESEYNVIMPGDHYSHFSTSYSITLPKLYANGADIIVSPEDVVNLIKSVIKVPHVVSLSNFTQYTVLFVQNA